MRYFLIAVALILPGCASLEYAGSSSYQIRQVLDANGKTGFDITAKNGKEVALVKARLEKKGEDFIVDLEEQGVAAFRGQEISMQASKIALEQTEKAIAAAAIGMAAPAAFPVIGGMLAAPGVGAGLLGAGVGAAGVIGAQKALAPKSPEAQAIIAPSPVQRQGNGAVAP